MRKAAVPAYDYDRYATYMNTVVHDPSGVTGEPHELTARSVRWAVESALQWPGATVTTEGDSFIITMPSGQISRCDPFREHPPARRHEEIRRGHLRLLRP